MAPSPTPFGARADRGREPHGPDRGSAAPASELQLSDRSRALLPAVEPDREVDDWGRSERAGDAFDSTVAEFLYRYWFRCEVEGIGNVPSSGGALLASNHAGALPPDAAMIAKAIREEHAHPRPLYTTLEHFFKGVPGVSALITKLGCVPANEANVQRLLRDEEQLVLAFPEGPEGNRKTYSRRYRVRRFEAGGHIETAMRSGAAIVPVCVVGTEEAMPVFARSRALGRLFGMPQLPLTATFPLLGPAGLATYLPAKLKVRFLEPIDTARMGRDPADDGGLVQTVSEEVRARIQENLHEMVASRKSVWRG